MCWKTRATHISICMEYSAYLVCVCNFNTKRSVSNIYTCMWLIWHFETKSSFATQTIVTQHDYDCLYLSFIWCVCFVYILIELWQIDLRQQNGNRFWSILPTAFIWMSRMMWTVHFDWFIKGHPLDNPSNKNSNWYSNSSESIVGGVLYQKDKTSIDVSRSCMCMHSREITLQST